MPQIAGRCDAWRLSNVQLYEPCRGRVYAMRPTPTVLAAQQQDAADGRERGRTRREGVVGASEGSVGNVQYAGSDVLLTPVRCE